jgi:hypothetical protein
MSRQTKPVTWQSVSRHKFFDEELLAKRQAPYTIDDLRLMLKGWTWERLLEHTSSFCEGVMFHGRIGRFMAKPCIAVCALDHIVVLRYVATSRESWTNQSVIDGSRHGGVILLNTDFTAGRTGDIKLTDLVIEGEP